MPALDLMTLRRRFSAPLLVVLALLVWYFNQQDDASLVPAAADGVIEQAIAGQRSGVWVDTDGRITRLLADDNEGSRHQRFILALDSGDTVLVAHNIDLARRIPAREGLSLTVRGRYEWNKRGGVIHWTHHDPDGREQGGWIMLNGTRYE
jgi:hypothetical protein